jgi:hypothetical protein
MENHEHYKYGKMHCLWHKLSIAALVVPGALLVADHWNHVVSALPYFMLLLCPPMHLFMYGHYHHGDKNNDCPPARTSW